MVHAGFHSSKCSCAGQYLAADNWWVLVIHGIGMGRNVEALKPRLEFLLDQGVLSSIKPQEHGGATLVRLTPYTPATDLRRKFGLTLRNDINWAVVADQCRPPPVLFLVPCLMLGTY